MTIIAANKYEGYEIVQILKRIRNQWARNATSLWRHL